MATNEQVTLKPQDLVLLLKLIANRRRGPFTFRQIAAELCWSSSTVHAAMGRLRLSRLVRDDQVDPSNVDLYATREFVLHGAKYCFPPSFGSVSRGVPTGYAAPPLRSHITQSSDNPPVWPTPDGVARGLTLIPLHPSVPDASRVDEQLYELLTLFDALRAGAARERELAAQLIQRRLV